MFGSDPLEELLVPDGTTVEEHDLVTDGDVLVGGQSVVSLGVRGGTVVAGERVRFGGDIEADGDCRLDMWCDVDGNVLVGRDAYLGERVHVAGQLMVSGDLDIGDDVDIEQGFEANGWIVIRNPVPTIVFLFIYLSQLLRLGEEEAATEVAEQFLGEDRSADPAVVPRGARVSDDAWRVSTPAEIGSNCRLHGNIRATEITVDEATEVFGSLRAKGDIVVGRRTVVHGDVTSKEGDVTVDDGAHVRGDIACENCALSKAAEVDGAIRTREALTIAGAVLEWDDLAPAVRRVDAPATELTPAIVPLGEGELSAEPTPAVVPLGDGALSVEPTPAVLPLSESAIEWDVREDRARRNGAEGDVAALIAEAEDR